jgi:hypothetical protein
MHHDVWPCKECPAAGESAAEMLYHIIEKAATDPKGARVDVILLAVACSKHGDQTTQCPDIQAHCAAVQTAKAAADKLPDPDWVACITALEHGN